ncbi:MAG: hypothetical protein JW803_04675 [Endomicrobiales bacterium]|nr:hypothetical protein [Endomicrobiales bacterium]
MKRKNRTVWPFLLSLAFFALICSAKEPRTVITGEKMEIINGGKKVVFTEGARVTKGENVLTARKLVQDKRNNRIDAEGNVKFKTFTEDREPIRGRSDKAYYSPDEGFAKLFSGRPEIVYFTKSSTSPVNLTADEITFYEKKEELHAKGEVEVISSSVTAFAPYAVFAQGQKKMVLTGSDPQPVLIHTEGDKKSTYTADRITFFINRDKVLLEGKVHCVVTAKDEDIKKNDAEKR